MVTERELVIREEQEYWERNFSPETQAKRKREQYTRAEIIRVIPPCEEYGLKQRTVFWAVYTTPEGEVTSKVYCYSNSLAGPRDPKRFKGQRAKL